MALYVGEGSERECHNATTPLAALSAGFLFSFFFSAGFQSLPPLPTSKLGPTGADSQVGGLVYILGPCGSLQRTLL